MATQHKVVFNFRPALNVPATANSTNGWTETFYRLPVEEDDVAITRSQTFLAFRRALLTPGWRCNKIRAYRWPLSRASKPFTPLTGDQAGTYSSALMHIAASVTDEQPYDVLIQDVSSASGRTRAWGMRGIGSDVVDAGGSYVAPSAFEINNFDLQTTMIAGGWAIRTQTVGTPIHITGAFIAGPLPAGTTLVPTAFSPVITVANTIPIPVATDVLRITGALGLVGLRGVWTVQSTEAVGGVLYAQLKAKRGRTLVGSYTGAGYCSVLTYALSQITGLAPSAGSSHRVGGLPGRLRGRRKRPAF